MVQLSPDLLGKLREGDEIHMNLYPEAGQIQQFIVLAGKEVLPRNGVKAHAHATLTAKDHKTVAPAAAEAAEAANVYGPVAKESPAATRHVPGARAAGAPVVESRAFEPRAGEPPRLRNPSRFSVGDEKPEEPREQPAEQPLYGATDIGNPGAPDLIRENPAEETPQGEQPEEPLYGPAKFGPTRSAPPPRVAATEAPDGDRSPFSHAPINRPKTTPVSAPKTTHASLTPPDNGNEYLPDDEPRRSKPRSSFGAADNNVATTAGEEDRGELDDNRLASNQPTSGKAGLSSGKTKLSKSISATATSDPAPTAWGPWMFVCCALFLSIGGNLYLGWTAAEFYSRYRNAIERMRSGGKETDED